MSTDRFGTLVRARVILHLGRVFVLIHITALDNAQQPTGRRFWLWRFFGRVGVIERG